MSGEDYLILEQMIVVSCLERLEHIVHTIIALPRMDGLIFQWLFNLMSLII